MAQAPSGTRLAPRGARLAPSGARLLWSPSIFLPVCWSFVVSAPRVREAMSHTIGLGQELSRSMVCCEFVVLAPGALWLGSACGMELCSPVYPDPVPCPTTPSVLSRYQLMRVCMRAWNRFSQVRLFVTPWTVARQAPLSLGFSRQES